MRQKWALVGALAVALSAATVACITPEEQRLAIIRATVEAEVLTEVFATATAVAPTPTPTATPTPRDLLVSLISEELGGGNRGLRKLTSLEVSVDNTVVTIRWTIDDNFTSGMIKRRAMMEVLDMLRVIHESGVEYEGVHLEGTFSLADAFGNAEEAVVVDLGYRRSTISRINWDSMLTDNAFVIADRATFHPAFRD